MQPSTCVAKKGIFEKARVQPAVQQEVLQMLLTEWTRVNGEGPTREEEPNIVDQSCNIEPANMRQ